jgi:hypothetical protein
MASSYVQSKYPTHYSEAIVQNQIDELREKTKHLTGTTVATLVNGNLDVDGQLKIGGVVVTPGGGGDYLPLTGGTLTKDLTVAMQVRVNWW